MKRTRRKQLVFVVGQPAMWVTIEGWTLPTNLRVPRAPEGVDLGTACGFDGSTLVDWSYIRPRTPHQRKRRQ